MNLVRSAFLAVALVASSGSVATAQEVSLEDYLASMDRTEVSFRGSISYDNFKDDFLLKDTDGEYFFLSMDAGRDLREQIETECGYDGFMSNRNWCEISGSGTVEIRGSDIYISIEAVDQLGQQE